MKRSTFVNSLIVILLALWLILGCNEQQSTPPAEQAPASPVTVAQTPMPSHPQGATRSQTTPAINQPRLGWVLPVKWMVIKDEQSSFAALEDMLATNWAVVLDNSGSMRTTQCSGNDSRMVAGGKAIINFVRQRPEKDNFALILFTGSSPYARVAVPLGRDRAAFEQEVRRASPDFDTPLGPAIDLAYAALFGQGKQQHWHGTYHIVVVTDGDWNVGSDPGPIVKRIVEGSPVQIHTVGFCTGSGHRLNIPGYTTYASADNAEQVNAGLQAVLKAESESFVDPQSPSGK